MKRIMVIGCCGAGKSTLSRKIHAALNIELIHLDQYYWKPNWREPSKQEWSKTVEKLSAKESWIIDGNYGGTMDMRIRRADTIIYLDYPTILCLLRVIKRIIKNWGKVRKDMPKGCEERFDFSFLHYVATFKVTRGKKQIKKLKLVKKNKTVFIFHNDTEVTKFLKNLDHLKTSLSGSIK